MTIDALLKEAEQKFEQKKAERQGYLDKAEECLTEMTLLRGEYRVLQRLSDEYKPNNKATVVEAVPDKEK